MTYSIGHPTVFEEVVILGPPHPTALNFNKVMARQLGGIPADLAHRHPECFGELLLPRPAVILLVGVEGETPVAELSSGAHFIPARQPERDLDVEQAGLMWSDTLPPSLFSIRCLLFRHFFSPSA